VSEKRPGLEKTESTLAASEGLQIQFMEGTGSDRLRHTKFVVSAEQSARAVKEISGCRY
jgi:hypothetical protein